MPRLQKLINEYTDHSDVQFVSINIDDNPGLIQPFLKEHQLSLCVIPAEGFARDTLKLEGLPQNWIVDGTGVVRLKGIGYDSTEKWVTGMKEAIERVQTAAAPTP